MILRASRSLDFPCPRPRDRVRVENTPRRPWVALHDADCAAERLCRHHVGDALVALFAFDDETAKLVHRPTAPSRVRPTPTDGRRWAGIECVAQRISDPVSPLVSGGMDATDARRERGHVVVVASRRPVYSPPARPRSPRVVAAVAPPTSVSARGRRVFRAPPARTERSTARSASRTVSRAGSSSARQRIRSATSAGERVATRCDTLSRTR